MIQERLEEAKRLYETANANQRYVLESLFPELKESEDEKVRKELIDYFKENNAALAFRGISNECILAWLEKQGRHKPTDKIEPENTPIEGKFPYNNSSDTLEDEIENIWGKLSCQGLFTATKEGFSEVATHFANYLKKQKPAAWIEPNSDFELCLKHIMEEAIECGDTHNLKADAELLYNIVHKPAEWNEEDEKIYSRIYDLIHAAAYANYEVDEDGKELGEYSKITNWFKSIKDRIHPQTKQEWSKEDERMRTNLIELLIRLSANTRTDSTSINRSYPREIDWLKSLRPQSKLKS